MEMLALDRNKDNSLFKGTEQGKMLYKYRSHMDDGAVTFCLL